MRVFSLDLWLGLQGTREFYFLSTFHRLSNDQMSIIKALLKWKCNKAWEKFRNEALNWVFRHFDEHAILIKPILLWGFSISPETHSAFETTECTRTSIKRATEKRRDQCEKEVKQENSRQNWLSRKDWEKRVKIFKSAWYFHELRVDSVKSWQWVQDQSCHCRRRDVIYLACSYDSLILRSWSPSSGNSTKEEKSS